MNRQIVGVSVLLLLREKWVKEAWPWLAGFAGFCVRYAFHVAAIDGRVDKSGSVGFWINGGVAHLVAAGLVGALLTVRGQRRLGLFLTACVLIPHVTFLFFGSAGRDMITGAVPGYWAMLVVPVALALAPVALSQFVNPYQLDSCLRNEHER